MKSPTPDHDPDHNQPPSAAAPQTCLFAQMPTPGKTVGVVSAAQPSSLALLAAGVAGMAARRARRERGKQSMQPT